MLKKPPKKNDRELFSLIEKKINEAKYIFVSHATQRLSERFVNQLDVLNILKGKPGYERKRNKVKDSYENQYYSELPQDWKYCIEGREVDDIKIRIIISFEKDLMPIITVINITKRKNDGN